MLADDYEQEQADLRAKIEMLENEIPVLGKADTHYSERYGQCRICSCTEQVQRTPSAGCDNQLQLYRHTPRQFTL